MEDKYQEYYRVQIKCMAMQARFQGISLREYMANNPRKVAQMETDLKVYKEQLEREAKPA